LEGRAAFRERFAKTFAEHPQNKAWSVNRIALGNGGVTSLEILADALRRTRL
jgi:hypothetical protein